MRYSWLPRYTTGAWFVKTIDTGYYEVLFYKSKEFKHRAHREHRDEKKDFFTTETRNHKGRKKTSLSFSVVSYLCGEFFSFLREAPRCSRCARCLFSFFRARARARARSLFLFQLWTTFPHFSIFFILKALMFFKVFISRWRCDRWESFHKQLYFCDLKKSR